MKRDTTTWIEHTAISLGGSFLVGIFSGLWAAVLMSGFFAAYFVLIREARDERAHKERGDWDTPSAQGVTPRIDQWGDLIGPVTVFVTFVAAGVLCGF